MNHEKDQPLRRDGGLKVPYRKKKRLVSVGVVGATHPIAPNVINEFTRGRPTVDVASSMEHLDSPHVLLLVKSLSNVGQL